MTETNPIHPKVRKFAIKTNAESISSMSSQGSGRIHYPESSTKIIHVGQYTDVPDGYQANLTFGPTPTIDLFPQ